MTDQEDAATDLGLPTDSSSEAESDSSSEAAPPSVSTESSDSDDRSAAARYPPGMAAFGYCLLLGKGGLQDNVFGLMNVTEAAGLGCDYGAYLLGWAFFNGAYGLPKDSVRARYWLNKLVELLAGSFKELLVIPSLCLASSCFKHIW